MTFYTFANATTAIPLSNLDSNFATPITLGNTAVTINGTFSSIGNLTLNNANITSVAATFPNSFLANSTTTIGNTTVTLGSTSSSIGNLTLNNVTVASGNSTVTKETVTTITSPAATNLTIQSAGTTAMTIDTSQNVGIGTTSTYGSKMFVLGSANAGVAVSDNTNTIAMYGNGGTAVALGTPNSVPLFFTTGSTERMRIDSSGNVGIGTSSPGAKLHVVNATGGTAISAGNANASLYVNYLDGGVNYIGGSTTVVRNGAGTTEFMRIDSSGNVGIGTSSPNASAILDAQSTTKGVRFPNMTTTQKNAISSPAAGLVVFDTTLAKLCVYSGSAWQTITSI